MPASITIRNVPDETRDASRLAPSVPTSRGRRTSAPSGSRRPGGAPGRPRGLVARPNARYRKPASSGQDLDASRRREATARLVDASVVDLAAPCPMQVATDNVLRRASHSGDIRDGVELLAHAELLRLRVGTDPQESLPSRVWPLRRAVTANDAWCVAPVETRGAELGTLDEGFVKAPGPRCSCPTSSDPRRREPDRGGLRGAATPAPDRRRPRGP